MVIFSFSWQFSDKTRLYFQTRRFLACSSMSRSNHELKRKKLKIDQSIGYSRPFCLSTSCSCGEILVEFKNFFRRNRASMKSLLNSLTNADRKRNRSRVGISVLEGGKSRENAKHNSTSSVRWVWKCLYKTDFWSLAISCLFCTIYENSIVTHRYFNLNWFDWLRKFKAFPEEGKEKQNLTPPPFLLVVLDFF